MKISPKFHRGNFKSLLGAPYLILKNPMLPVDILYHGDRANSVLLGVLVAFLLLFFATVTDFMKKADVFSKNGRIGDGEKRVLELWMTNNRLQ